MKTVNPTYFCTIFQVLHSLFSTRPTFRIDLCTIIITITERPSLQPVLAVPHPVVLCVSIDNYICRDINRRIAAQHLRNYTNADNTRPITGLLCLVAFCFALSFSFYSRIGLSPAAALGHVRCVPSPTTQSPGQRKQRKPFSMGGNVVTRSCVERAS